MTKNVKNIKKDKKAKKNIKKFKISSNPKTPKIEKLKVWTNQKSTNPKNPHQKEKTKNQKVLRRQDSNCFCFVYFCSFFFSFFWIILLFFFSFFSVWVLLRFSSIFAWCYLVSFFGGVVVFLSPVWWGCLPPPPLGGAAFPMSSVGWCCLVSSFLLGGAVVLPSPVWWCFLPSPPSGVATFETLYGCHGLCWSRHEAAAATTAFVGATRAAVSRCSPRRCPPPQLRPQGEDEGGGVRGQRGGRERDVLRPEGTDDPSSGDAAGASVWGGRAARKGSHGRFRGCLASWRWRRGRHRGRVPPPGWALRRREEERKQELADGRSTTSMMPSSALWWPSAPSASPLDRLPGSARFSRSGWTWSRGGREGGRRGRTRGGGRRSFLVLVVFLVSGMFAVLVLCCTSRCAPFCCRQAKMLGIMAGMNQKNRYVARCRRIFPVVAQRQIPMVFRIPQLPYIWWSMSLLCSCSWFYRSLTCPSVCNGWCRSCSEWRNTAEAPQLQFEGHQHLCRGAEADFYGLDYSADHRNSPSCSRTRLVVAPFCESRAGRRHPCRAEEGHPHGLVAHWDSPVAVLGQGGSMTLGVRVVQVSQGYGFVLWFWFFTWTCCAKMDCVFTAPRGTVLVMGSSAVPQLPPAPLVCVCISVWTGLRCSLPISVDGLLRRWFLRCPCSLWCTGECWCEVPYPWSACVHQLRRGILGALDGQQLLVVEGSRVPGSLGPRWLGTLIRCLRIDVYGETHTSKTPSAPLPPVGSTFRRGTRENNYLKVGFVI